MNARILGLRVGGTVFGLVCVAQMCRLATHAAVFIAGYAMPIWASGVAAVATAVLCAWMWASSYDRAGRQGPPHAT